MVLDEVDRRILTELMSDCRVSYSQLAQELGLTVNAVKKRIGKLLEQGIIRQFFVAVNAGLVYGGVPVNEVLGWVATDGSEDESQLINEIGSFPEVHYVFKTTRNTYGSWSMVPGFDGLAKLVTFLEGLHGVTQVDTDVVLPLSSPSPDRSPKLSTPRFLYDFTFTRPDLLVLRCLKEDPRMTISGIAKRTQLTPKRVRKILDVFRKTRAVCTQAEWDNSAAGLMAAYLRIHFDVTKQSLEGLRDWIFVHYPQNWYRAFSLVDKASTLIQSILADNIFTFEEISEAVNSVPGVLEVDTLVVYRARGFPGRFEEYVDELLKQL